MAPSETRRAGLRRELAEELQCRVGVGDSIVRCSYDHSSLAGVTTVYTVYRSRLVTHPTPNRDEGVVDLAWTLPASPPAKMLEPFREVLIRGVGLPEATEARTGE